MTILAKSIEVPDCVAPYHIEPMVINAIFWGGLAVLVAVTILIIIWIESK